jgi:hypothetical protein
MLAGFLRTVWSWFRGTMAELAIQNYLQEEGELIYAKFVHILRKQIGGSFLGMKLGSCSPSWRELPLVLAPQQDGHP